MNDKTEQALTDELRLAAKSAAPYGTAMIGASHLIDAADTIDNLRDYFAAQAIGPLLQQIETYPDENWRLGIAIDAYAMADAMLAVRADAQRRLGDITTIRARGAQGVTA